MIGATAKAFTTEDTLDFAQGRLRARRKIGRKAESTTETPRHRGNQVEHRAMGVTFTTEDTEKDRAKDKGTIHHRDTEAQRKSGQELPVGW